MDDKLDDKSCFVHRHYAASGTFNLNDVRWAMGIVRARAVWITRSTTGTSFPALIPLLDLVPHRPGSGGSMKLGVDNVVTVTSGKTFTGGMNPAARFSSTGRPTPRTRISCWRTTRSPLVRTLTTRFACVCPELRFPGLASYVRLNCCGRGARR